MSKAQPPTWLSTADAAERLGIGRRGVEVLVERGELPAYKIGRLVRYRLSDLDEFIETRRRYRPS